MYHTMNQYFMKPYTMIGLCHKCHSSGVKITLTKLGEKDGMVTQIKKNMDSMNLYAKNVNSIEIFSRFTTTFQKILAVYSTNP